MQMLAVFEPQSQARYKRDAKAEALKLPIIKVQTPIANLGSAKTQGTQGMFVMKINETVAPELQVIPKITNLIPAQTIVITKLRCFIKLHHADPKLNVPNRLNIVLDEDVLEKTISKNRIKDNGSPFENPSMTGLLLVPSRK